MKKFNKDKIVQISLISFFLTSICVLTIYAINKIYPFGTKTLLTMDMSGQYVNYLAYFRNIITDNANVFYNFSMNLGSNCYGLFAYYISNPLNILLCFFDIKNITEGIFFLNIIKIALASTTMTILLRKTTKLNKLYTIMLSIMYGLMSYNIVYSQNIMWLDGTIYLPLVVLGIEKIIKKESNLLYIFSLFLCIVSNFYIGYMVGIFSVIYALCRFLLLSNSIKSFWKDNRKILLEYIKSTIITLLLSMIILLPVLINLLNSKADISADSFKLDTYYSPIDVLSKMAIGAFNVEQLEFGPPSIFCGTLTIIMVMLFFINKKIDKKEKVLALILVAGFWLCFTIIPLNLVFHMLQSPVWFPFRYSFLFSFLMILLSARSLEKIDDIELNSILKVQGIAILILLILHKFSYPYLTTLNVILTILLILTNGILIWHSTKKQKVGLLLLIVIMLEMTINGYQIVKQINYVQKDEFQKVFNVSENIEKYRSKKDEFYRIDNHIRRSMNDDMLYNYNGFYHYSSTSGKNNKNFLTNFGIRNNLIQENATDITLPMLSILGIKYEILKQEDKNRYNIEWFEQVDENVFENKYNLGLGYVVDDNAKNVVLKENEPLENQNELLSKIANIDEKVFEKVPIENKEKIIKNKNDEMYLVIKAENVSSDAIKIYFDEQLTKSIFETNENSNNVIYVPQGVENISVDIKDEFKGKCIIDVYKFLEENFEKLYNKISKNQLNIQSNSNSHIKATINADEDGVLLTSIIYDDGWSVKIDGKKVDTEVVAEDLLAVNITKGEHTIEFKFVPAGFYAGLVLAFIGAIWIIIDKTKTIIKKKEYLIS